MESNDRFFDVKFYELDVLLLLKDIIWNGMVLKIVHLL